MNKCNYYEIQLTITHVNWHEQEQLRKHKLLEDYF